MRGLMPVALSLAAALVAGCGSDLPRAAEPAQSPKLRQAPSGELLAVGNRPEGLVVDPVTGLLAVAVREPDQLVLLDLDTGRVVDRVPLPASARHLALARPGGPVLVPAERADELVRVSLPGGRTTRVGVGPHPHDAASAAGAVFVADEFGDSVSVVRGNRVGTTLEAPVQPGGLVRAGPFVALVAVRKRVLATYDARARRLLGEIDAGVGPTHIVACGDRAFVADTQGNRILEFRISSSTRLVGSTDSAGAPYGIAADCRRHAVWVTSTAGNTAVAYRFSGRGLRPLSSFPTVRQPNSIAVDPRSGDAYVSASLGNAIQRIVPEGPGE